MGRPEWVPTTSIIYTFWLTFNTKLRNYVFPCKYRVYQSSMRDKLQHVVNLENALQIIVPVSARNCLYVSRDNDILWTI